MTVFFGGDHEVARKGEFQPAGDRMSMQRGDPGFVAATDRGGGLGDSCKEVDGVITVAMQAEQMPQVGPGTKTGSVSCEHDDARGVVVLRFLHRSPECVDEGVIECVASSWTVQEQPADGAVLLDDQRWRGCAAHHAIVPAVR